MSVYLAGILIINVFFAVVTDMTDFPDNAKKLISKIITKRQFESSDYRLHLLDCSLCQTFWASNLWLIVFIIMFGTFNIWMLIAPVLSCILVSHTSEILLFIKDCISYIIDTLRKLIIRG